MDTFELVFYKGMRFILQNFDRNSFVNFSEKKFFLTERKLFLQKHFFNFVLFFLIVSSSSLLTLELEVIPIGKSSVPAGI